MIVKCLFCNIEFEKKPCEIEKSPNHYCSRSCSAKNNNRLNPKRKKNIKFCKNCQKQITGNGKTYCSIKCQQKHGFNEKIEQWKNGLAEDSKG